jgi:SRSO17 transposase
LPASAFASLIATISLLIVGKEWLLIEWPEGKKEPTKYWLSTLPSNISFHRLVDYAKLRWLIERDYEELKQEVGLGDFEGGVARLPPLNAGNAALAAATPAQRAAAQSGQTAAQAKAAQKPSRPQR